MTPRQQQINQELAGQMGFTVLMMNQGGTAPFYQLQEPDKSKYHRWRRTEDEAWADAPAFSCDPAARQRLVEWMATLGQRVQMAFVENLLGQFGSFHYTHVIRAMTATPDAVAAAALKSVRATHFNDDANRKETTA